MESTVLTDRIQSSFSRQELMKTLGASLESVQVGEVHIRLLASDHITQQYGFAHAGAITSIADSACGYACYTKMDEGDAVLSVEFKINLLAPAMGDSFLAIGKVIRSGKTLSVSSAEVFADKRGETPKCIAIMQATMMRLEGKADLNG